MSELVWRTAAEALSEHTSKKLLLMYPTRAILKEIAALRGIDELFAFAGRPRVITPITPVLPLGVRADEMLRQPRCSSGLGGVDFAHAIHGIGVLDPLVVAIALHPRKAQGQPARIAAAGL